MKLRLPLAKVWGITSFVLFGVVLYILQFQYTQIELLWADIDRANSLACDLSDMAENREKAIKEDVERLTGILEDMERTINKKALQEDVSELKTKISSIEQECSELRESMQPPAETEADRVSEFFSRMKEREEQRKKEMDRLINGLNH